MKIVILDGYTENPGDLSWNGFSELGDLTVYEYTATDEIVAHIGDAEIICTNKTPISKDTLDLCPHIRYIGVLATGYNVVDIDACRAKGIPVTNIPSYGTTAVAQYVFALLLAICHRVEHHNQAVQNGRWTTNRDFCFWDYPLIELTGKTMGIIGYGRIGRAVANIATSFGMKVLAYDTHSDDEAIVPLEALLKESDVISLHCPLFLETNRIINQRTISMMKDGVIIINTSRGQLIDEHDLRYALLNGKVYAAACDVVSIEPIQAGNPLLGLPNCLITPHIAWAPRESRERLMDIAVSNLRAFLAGTNQNTVNM